MKAVSIIVLIALISLSVLAKSPKFGENSPIVKLDLNNFDEKTQGFRGKPWVILFYAPWCPHCKDIQAVYEELNEKLSDQMTFAQIDCEKSIEIKDRFGVNAFPTIIIVSDETGAYHKFRGTRTTEAIELFLTKTYKEFPGIDIPNRPSLFKTLKQYYSQFQTPLLIGGIVLASAILIFTLIDLARGEKPKESTSSLNKLIEKQENDEQNKNKSKPLQKENKQNNNKTKDSKKQQNEKKNQ